MTERARRIVLLDRARLLRGPDLARLCTVLEDYGALLAKAWSLPAPSVIFRRDPDELMPGEMPLVMWTDNESDPGAGAVHYWDPSRGAPAADVYVDRSSGLNVGLHSVVEFASHEFEALLNEQLRNWRPMPFRPGVQCALEIADMCQDTLDVSVPDPKTGESVAWKCSNFVLPAWFEESAPGPYDYAGRLSRPGEIGPEGYAILRQRDGSGRWTYWYEDSSGQRFGAQKPGARKHMFGRAARLLAGEV